MQFTYKTSGVCAQTIFVEIVDDVVQSVKFTGGCNGNLQGISSLVKGMSVDEVIEKLSNIRCGFKNTSCPDQLAKALKQYKAEN